MADLERCIIGILTGPFRDLSYQKCMIQSKVHCTAILHISFLVWLMMSCLGMLGNFVQLIKDIGHIPNGNRIYYYRRTQPPLFISMVDAYYKVGYIHFEHRIFNCNLFLLVGHRGQNIYRKQYSVSGKRIPILDGQQNQSRQSEWKRSQISQV